MKLSKTLHQLQQNHRDTLQQYRLANETNFVAGQIPKVDATLYNNIA
mgnify:CR=1 FL=1